MTPGSRRVIPNVFHFCYGLLPGAPFGFLEYLAIRSASEINRPKQVYLHYQHECSGPWWDRVKEIATLNKVEAPCSIHGRPIHHFAHRSDVLRLSILQEQGGIYLDIDTLCVRPFTPLLGHQCVLGRESARGLCNAVILSEPHGEFVSAWLDSYRTFRSLGSDQYWDEHSVVVPGQLARQRRLRSHLTVLDHRAFFFPLWDEMQHLFESEDATRFKDSFCIHYWESKTYQRWLSKINEASALSGTSNFSRFARRALGSEPGDFDEPTGTGKPSEDSRDREVDFHGSSRSSVRLPNAVKDAFRWLKEQAKDAAWLPCLFRNLGAMSAVHYIVQRLRVTAGLIKSPVFTLRSKRARHALSCRSSYRGLLAFDRVFVHRRYAGLDDLDVDGLIVDCGAGAGYASAAFLTQFPSAQILALEPDADALSLLETNMASYGARCRIERVAVWPESAGLVFEETARGPARRWSRHLRLANGEEASTITGKDLGSVLRESGFERIALLRINIAGTESALFAADCRAWLAKVDNLVVELHGPDARTTALDALSSGNFTVTEQDNVVFARAVRP